MHLDEGRLQRLIDGELASEDAARARAHLAACADCRALLAAAEREQREVEALLRAVDEPAPALDADRVAALAGATAPPEPLAGTAAPRILRPPGDSGAGRHHRLAWAAAFLGAVILAGGAFAIPGSPVRAWVVAALGRVAGGTEAPAPAPTHGPVVDSLVAGIAVDPGLELRISFTSQPSEGQVRIVLTGGDQVVVRAPAGAAAFRSEDDRLVIDATAPSATFEIEIPRDAPRVEIEVGGVRRFMKDGASIVADGHVAADGPYVLPLAPSGP
jgi:hypothetical protein